MRFVKAERAVISLFAGSDAVKETAPNPHCGYILVTVVYSATTDMVNELN